MRRSIQWRLVASYVLLTLLSVSLVGLLALSLLKYYVVQQEERYLLANAEAIARQAGFFMQSHGNSPIPKGHAVLLELAHTSAFLGNARVRILDPQQNVLADSGTEKATQQMLWVAPPWEEEKGLSNEHFSTIIIGSSFDEHNDLPPWLDEILEEIEKEISLPAGRTVAKVRRVEGVWGSQFSFEMEQEIEVEGEVTTIETNIVSSSLSPEPIERSSRRVLVPIGEEAKPLGYVELSNSPDLATEALSTTRQAFFVASLGATLLAALVGLFVSRRLTAPLHQLTLATNLMSSGNLSARASVLSQDEIGQLAQQFNQMARRLEESFTELATERDTLRRFIADASHELRTPITALKSFNELLRGPAADDKSAQIEFLLESEQQLNRLEWITKNLLDLSRLEAGLVELELEEHDVAELLNAAAAPYRLRSEEQEITLTLDLPPSPQAIYADRARLDLTLSNLLDNALKFTPSGGQITLGATSEGKFMTLWVKDTGPGIDPNEQPHIFERFYRGRSSQASGSGLGLAIAQSIIQAHHGEITVTSEIGRGSRFVIQLPTK